MRRLGLWVANGRPSNADQMLSWKPGSLTCFYDYLQDNRVISYKRSHPEIPVIVRFQHPQNWRQNFEQSARNVADLVISKWPDLKEIDPYIYFANEMNLHYENGDENPGNQYMYETPEFYEYNARWVSHVANQIKNKVPEMKLVTPPFAFGHYEDGAPDDNGNPKDGWAGYDYLADAIRIYFNNIVTFHAYWGNQFGSNRDWLYDPEVSSWFAFRWERLIKLFKTRYNQDIKLIIDEAGNFGVSDKDFTDQVIYFGTKCLASAAVIAVTMFLWEDPTYSAGNMPNSWVQGCYNLSDHVSRLERMPDVVITPGQNVSDSKKVRMQLADGTVETIDFETYLRGVIPAEMPVRQVKDGGYRDAALQAQVVAARSYTKYRLEHPRNASFDLRYTDQAFDRNAIGSARADAAIKATNGVYLLTSDNKLFEAEYIKRCGREPCPFCNGTAYYFNETQAPDGKWVNRFCQDGANELAALGYTYREILDFYYGHLNVKYSDEPIDIPPEPPVEDGDTMFNFNVWIAKFIEQPGFNDASHCVTVEQSALPGAARCIGVHMLTPEENTFDHHVLMAVVDKDGASIPQCKIDWGWEGMQPAQAPNPVVLEKNPPEPPGNLALYKEYESVWVKVKEVPEHAITGSDKVKGMTTWVMPNEPPNAGDLYHRSFFVVWQVDVESPVVPPVIPPVDDPPVVLPETLAEVYETAVDIRDALEELIQDLEVGVIVPLESYQNEPL